MPPPKADEGFFCIVVPFVWGSKSSSSFMQGGCACGRTKGHENKRSLRSPFGNLRRTPMLIDWYWRFSFFWGYVSPSEPKVLWINTRKKYDSVTICIARKGQGAKPLADSRGRASGASPYFSSPLAFMASYCSIEIRQRRGFAPSFAEMMPRCSISSTKRPARA